MSNFGFNIDTTVLTLDGWKPINEIKLGDKCISYSIEGDYLEVDDIINTTINPNVNMLSVSNKWVEFVVGRDQLWYGWKRLWAKKGCERGKYFHKFSIPETTQEFNIICSAKYCGGSSNVTKEEASFIGWLLSDGYYKWSEDTKKTSSSFGNKRGIIGVIAQAQHKFHKEVESVLNSVNLSYTIQYDNNGNKTSPVNKYHLYSPELRLFMDRVVGERLPKHDINWPKHILSYNQEAIYHFLYNFWLADGDTKNQQFGGNKTIITQNKGSIYDAVMLAMFLQGKRVSSCNKNSIDDKCSSIRMLRNGHITMQEVKIKDIGVYETFDLLTKNGTYVIKQGDNISITCSSSFGAIK